MSGSNRAYTRARAAAPLQDLKPVQRAMIEVDFEEGGGRSAAAVCTTVTFNNPDTRAAFEKLFALKEHEVLNGIEITERGITGWFTSKRN